MRAFGVVFCDEVIELRLLLKEVPPRRLCRFLLESEVHALVAPILLRLPGLMRWIWMPSRNHQTESFEKLNSALGEAKARQQAIQIRSGRPAGLVSSGHARLPRITFSSGARPKAQRSGPAGTLTAYFELSCSEVLGWFDLLSLHLF